MLCSVKINLKIAWRALCEKKSKNSKKIKTNKYEMKGVHVEMNWNKI